MEKKVMERRSGVRWVPLAAIAVASVLAGCREAGQAEVPADAIGIDTRIGSAVADSSTSGTFGQRDELRGNTIPCVTAPHGLTYWTPQTCISDEKGKTPYRWEAEEWMGFRASHWLDGSATQDYGSFYVVPGCKPVPFDHAKETARPDYYRYANHELTGLGRSAIMRLDCDRVTFGVNSRHGDCRIAFVRSAEKGDELRAECPVHRIYNGNGQLGGHSSWAVVRFNKPVRSVTPVDGTRIDILFEDAPGPLLAKMGTSFTGEDAAAANLDGEIPGWDFDAVRAAVEAVWLERLSAVEVSGGDPEVARHFRTSLWRASLSPRMVSDFGAEPDYDDFNLWDTFRALHPLHTILDPVRDGEMMQALVRKYEKGGWMPIFPMWGSYTSAMIGDHAASVIADAYAKGIRNFDCEKAWQGIRRNAFEKPTEEEYIDGRGRRALGVYMELGYVPLESVERYAYHRREQSSRTLEYAYDDWCASVLARDFGSKDDLERLLARSGNWRNVFDPRTRWVQGRNADGSFLDDDNCFTKTTFITEGWPCHYSWFVPHDVEGLIEYMGRQEFEERLDGMFAENRYWHGNEPCHHIAYLFDYIDQPGKCREVVRHVMETEYRNTPGGLSGNDDAGQLSSWYVFACLGFYPVCPGKPEYALGMPAFDRIAIHLENGNDFVIEKETGGDQAQAGQSPAGPRFFLDGEKLSRPFITHDDILAGKKLTFVP
jgi:putative alpha-1,2-mannosidase